MTPATIEQEKQGYNGAKLKQLLDYLPHSSLEAISEDRTTLNLFEQAAELEVLRDDVAQLRSDIERQIRESEVDLESMRLQRDRHIEELRDKRETCLNKGDRKGADRILDEIAKVRRNLEAVAKRVKDSQADDSELKQRQADLHRRALSLFEITDATMHVATSLRHLAAQALSNANEVSERQFFRLEEVKKKTTRAAEAILQE